MRLDQLWFDFLSALGFLTRIPVPHSDRSLAKAVKFFPLVGLAVGAASAGVYLMLDPHFPRLVTAALVLLFMVCLTGGLHEDGLADTADAFGGGWHREQVLTILRDSRIGSYGAGIPAGSSPTFASAPMARAHASRNSQPQVPSSPEPSSPSPAPL